MATRDEAYDLICKSIQNQIDILADDDIDLTEDQIREIVRKIGNLNRQLEEYSNRFR
jgi:hypothetical protein